MMRLIVVAIFFECYKFFEYHIEFISYVCDYCVSVYLFFFGSIHPSLLLLLQSAICLRLCLFEVRTE